MEVTLPFACITGLMEGRRGGGVWRWGRGGKGVALVFGGLGFFHVSRGLRNRGGRGVVSKANGCGLKTGVCGSGFHEDAHDDDDWVSSPSEKEGAGRRGM